MSSKPPSTPAASYRMISVPEAQDLILQHTFRLQQQQVPLAEAVGCVLASDTQAMDNIPPYRASIKVNLQPRQGPHLLVGRQHVSCDEIRKHTAGWIRCPCC